jgi:hypothetical protein
MASSGTTNFSLDGADITLECYDRLQIRPAQLTTDHLRSINRSFGLVQSRWANRGINLWTISEVTIPLVQGITTYGIDSDTIFLAPDTFLRQYQMGSPVSITPAFVTSLNSSTVTMTWADHGLSVGQYLDIIVPVSVGGLILYGFYAVASVPDANTLTFAAASNATAGASGGSLPAFATTSGSSTVTVTLNKHGYAPGQFFNIEVSTVVGGLTLFGNYTIATVTTNTFTITATSNASTTDTGTENGGLAYVSGQNQNASPTDILFFPISRNDYAAIPNKTQQGRPTSLWFDRLVSPTVTIWPVPDGNGPYELHYYKAGQIQDLSAIYGQNPDMPFRFLEAFCAGVSAHLAMKWAPQSLVMLKQYADECFKEASDEDREKVSTYIAGDFSSY